MNFKIIIFVIAALICQIAASEINNGGIKLRQTRDSESVKKSDDKPKNEKRGWWWWGSPYVIREESRPKREALDLPLIKIPKLGAHFRSVRNVKPNSKDVPDKMKKSGASRGSGANNAPSKRGWCWWCWWWWGSPYSIREETRVE